MIFIMPFPVHHVMEQIGGERADIAAADTQAFTTTPRSF